MRPRLDCGRAARERRDRVFVLAAQAQRRAAGRQYVDRGTGRQQVGDIWRGGGDVFAVVQHEQQAAARADACAASRRLAGSPSPSGPVSAAMVGITRRDRSGARGARTRRRRRSHPAGRRPPAIASRVLPMPPGPVRVTSRTSARRTNATSAATNSSRPSSCVVAQAGCEVAARAAGSAPLAAVESACPPGRVNGEPPRTRPLRPQARRRARERAGR